MSSGGDEPVADKGAPGHSIFAWAILKSLRQIDEDTFTGEDLFHDFIQPAVAGRSDQMPHYSELIKSGHEWGDFVFSRVAVAKTSISGGEVAKVAGRGTPVVDPGIPMNLAELLEMSSAAGAAGAEVVGEGGFSETL